MAEEAFRGLQQQLEMAMNRIVNREGEVGQLRARPQGGGGHQKTLDQMFFEPKGLMPEPLNSDMYQKVEKFREWSLQVREFLGIYCDDIHAILRAVEGTKEAPRTTTPRRSMHPGIGDCRRYS